MIVSRISILLCNKNYLTHLLTYKHIQLSNIYSYMQEISYYLCLKLMLPTNYTTMQEFTYNVSAHIQEITNCQCIHARYYWLIITYRQAITHRLCICLIAYLLQVLLCKKLSTKYAYMQGITY